MTDRRVTGLRDTRDRWFLIVLLAHAPLAAVLGVFLSDEGLLHVFGEAVGPAVVACVAYALFAGRRPFRAIGAALLKLYSGVIIHLGGGLVEWHSHVFVGLAMLILYYDWLPNVVAAGDLSRAVQAAPVSISAWGNDEIGRMTIMVNAPSRSFDSMVAHYDEARGGLGEMIDHVQSTTAELQTQAARMRSASQDFATTRPRLARRSST